MGLQPLSTGHWLPFAISAEERARKQQVLADHANQASGRWTPGTGLTAGGPGDNPSLTTAEHALEALVAAAVPGAELPTAELSPVVRAALRVPDDLCLLMRSSDDGCYRLASACVCAPSYWSLPQMLGRTLPGLHAGVADMTPALAGRIDAFFQGLRETDLFERRNWSVHGSPERWQPRPAAGELLERVWMRSERQTLRRVGADAVLFTIRVEIAPLAEIAALPTVRAALDRALTLLAGPSLAAFGGPQKLQRVQAVLAALPGR